MRTRLCVDPADSNQVTELLDSPRDNPRWVPPEPPQLLKNNFPILEQSGHCVALRYLLNEEESGMNFRDFFAMSESVWIEGSKKNSSVALQCNCQTFDLLSLQPSKHPLCTLWGCAAFFYLYVHHLGLNQSHNRKGSVQLISERMRNLFLHEAVLT